MCCDEILRFILELVGKCPSDDRPLTERWGGNAPLGVNGNLAMILSGTRRVGEAGGAVANETFALGNFDSLVEGLAQS